MKTYMIWDPNKNDFFHVCEPEREPYWYPISFQSYESAESYLKNHMRNYELAKVKNNMTKRTYFFKKVFDNNKYYKGYYEEKYVIIERTMK